MRGAPAPGSVGAIAFRCKPHCWQYAKPTGVAVPQRGHAIVLLCADGRGAAAGGGDAIGATGGDAFGPAGGGANGAAALPGIGAGVANGPGAGIPGAGRPGGGAIGAAITGPPGA